MTICKEEATQLVARARMSANFGAGPNQAYTLLHDLCDAVESQAQEIEALRADAARYRWLRSITIHEWHRMANYTADALDAEVDFRNPAVRMEKP